MENSARTLIEALYRDGAHLDANWDHITDESLRKLREAAASGDEAVQKLLTEMAFSNFQDVDEASRLLPALAGIKAALVTEMFSQFPTTSVDDLRAAAEAAGYDVEVLA